MKHLILTVALALLPAAAMAQDAPAADPAAAAPAAAPAALPKCTAKVQDSCDQSKTTEKNALDHYPADKRDAGNNKIGAPAAAPTHVSHKRAGHKHAAHKATTTTTTTTNEEPAK